MVQTVEVEAGEVMDHEAERALRMKNLADWVSHLDEHPEDDFDSIFELKIPMSLRIEIMRRGAEKNISDREVVVTALMHDGIMVGI